MVSGADPFGLAGRKSTSRQHCGTDKNENKFPISSSSEKNKIVETLEDVDEKDEGVKATVEEQETLPAMCALAAGMTNGLGVDKTVEVC